MEQSNRTLGSIIGQNTQQSEGQSQQQNFQDQQSLTSYLTVFSVNLTHRIPDVRDWQNIDYENVQSISEFCLPCTNIALRTWQEFTQTSEVSRRHRMLPRQGRAA
jgi:hypothetical protein